MNGAGCWWVYLLECADGTYYIGLAQHLTTRLAEHNGEQQRGARYTRSRRPVALLLATPCPTRAAAARLEWWAKRLTRPHKARLQADPHWLAGAAALKLDALVHSVDHQEPETGLQLS